MALRLVCGLEAARFFVLKRPGHFASSSVKGSRYACPNAQVVGQGTLWRSMHWRRALSRIAHELQSRLLKGGYIREYIGEYYGGHQEGYEEFRLELIIWNEVNGVTSPFQGVSTSAS